MRYNYKTKGEYCSPNQQKFPFYRPLISSRNHEHAWCPAIKTLSMKLLQMAEDHYDAKRKNNKIPTTKTNKS